MELNTCSTGLAFASVTFEKSFPGSLTAAVVTRATDRAIQKRIFVFIRYHFDY
jgi:hypothetical protein